MENGNLSDKNKDETSTTFAESSVEVDKDSCERRKNFRRMFFRNEGRLKWNSIGEAEFSEIDAENGDLTPGSLEIWVDLPDKIKYDPSLAPFKNLYEKQHGKLERSYSIDAERQLLTRKDSILRSLGEVASSTVIDKEIEENEINNTHATSEVKHKHSSKQKKILQIVRIAKLSGLVACWMFLTISLLLNREKEDQVLHTTVSSSTAKAYQLPGDNGTIRVLVTLTGPFDVANGANSSDDEAGYLHVWLQRRSGGDTTDGNSTTWSIKLVSDSEMDFSPSDTRSKVIELSNDNVYETTAKNQSKKVKRKIKENDTKYVMAENNESSVFLILHTSSRKSVPLTISYQMNPFSEREGIIYAAFLLLGLYILIVFEVVNRTLAALLMSSLGVAVLAIGGARPTMPELMSWLDVETLLLLFSMMILVAILAETGLFDYLAILAFEKTSGRTWPLINTLCFFTAFFSTFLDNVTTVLLMTPVTIRLCEVMQLNPVPILMSMVIFSNVGGAATPVGDPPNVIIASNPPVVRAGINFTNFTLHMTLGILLVCVQTYLQIRFVYRDMNKLRHSVPQDIHELRQEIAVWRRAAESLSSYSKDEDVVRKALQKKVDKLTTALERRKAGGQPAADSISGATLQQMKLKFRIRDKPLLIKSAVCVAFVVVVFFLHAIPMLQRLSLGWTALLGALLLLLLAEREDLEPILARVEWSTLLFFAALFVLMEALSKLGLIEWIGNLTESVIEKVSKESQLAVALLLILWVSGLASAFVDNIPLTTMMIRVTTALAEPSGLGLPLPPLVWALSFGACLGGNGTLIGASANVVCAGVAEQHGYRFTFLEFLKFGFPIMIGNLIVATLYLLLCHCLIGWHL